MSRGKLPNFDKYKIIKEIVDDPFFFLELFYTIAIFIIFLINVNLFEVIFIYSIPSLALVTTALAILRWALPQLQSWIPNTPELGGSFLCILTFCAFLFGARLLILGFIFVFNWISSVGYDTFFIYVGIAIGIYITCIILIRYLLTIAAIVGFGYLIGKVIGPEKAAEIVKLLLKPPLLIEKIKELIDSFAQWIQNI